MAFYSKIDFKLRYIRVKEFVNEIKCNKSSISNIIYGIRHSKPFTNCHDTLYLKSYFEISNVYNIRLQ